MVKDLRSFLEDLRREIPEEPVEIRKEVDPKTSEIRAVVAALEKQQKYPALLFRKVKGSKFPMITNVAADREKLAVALGVPLENLLDTYSKREANAIPPKLVKSGPVKDVILKGEEVNLFGLPLSIGDELADAPYVGAAIAVARDLATGGLNLGIYRHRLRERDELNIYYSWGKYMHYVHKAAEDQDKPLEVALVIGMHPTLYMASQTHKAPGMAVDEYSAAGGLMGEALEVVKCETVDLVVPAYAEMVIEGVIPPKIRKHEGPYGEYTGYYGQVVDTPIIKVKAITHRRDAIFQDVVSGSTAETNILNMVPREANHLAELRKIVPTVKTVHIPLSGVRAHAYVSLKKVNEGDAKTVILALLGLDHWVKHVIAVDDDIDVYDDHEVLWAIATRLRADEDIFIVPGARGNRLDPMTYNYLRDARDSTVTKMGIDATIPIGIPYEFPKKVEVSLAKKINLDEYLKFEKTVKAEVKSAGSAKG